MWVTMSAETQWQHLTRVGIFADLDEADRRALAACMKPRAYGTGEVIVGQEDAGDSLFLLTAGRVKVVLYGDSGREVILSILKPGEIFGEMSLLDNQPRSASVMAVEASQALVLERAAFVRHLHDHPNTALAVMRELSRRLRQADRVIGNLALLDVYGRVAGLLKELAQREGVQTDEGLVIRERPTQAEIAAMVGTSRETVSRALSDFQRRGLIVMSGKQVVLPHGCDYDPGEI